MSSMADRERLASAVRRDRDDSPAYAARRLVMGILSNTRHEKYSQNRAKGMTIDDAYAAAGFKRNRSNAAQLNAKQHIQARIAELQNKAAERTIKTIEDIVAQLDEDRARAHANGQAGAAVSATMGQAKILGLITNKHHVVGVLTHEEALDQLEGLTSE